MAMDGADIIMDTGDMVGPEVTGLSHAAGDAEGPARVGLTPPLSVGGKRQRGTAP